MQVGGVDHMFLAPCLHSGGIKQRVTGELLVLTCACESLEQVWTVLWDSEGTSVSVECSCSDCFPVSASLFCGFMCLSIHQESSLRTVFSYL